MASLHESTAATHFRIERLDSSSASTSDSFDAAQRDDDGRPRRTGTMWTASAHIVTAVIGSGVLSLAWSMSKLGWVAGPLTLLAFACITYFTSVLLADCYRSPATGPILVTSNNQRPPSSHGVAMTKRNYTYMDAVETNLGGAYTNFCALVQYTNFIGIAIGYTITASISMVAIAKANCYHRRGHDAQCVVSNNPSMMLFGAVQIFLSQIPNFSKIWWLSIVAAIMSFSYAGIALGLGVGKATEMNHSHGTLGGLLTNGHADDIWTIFQALGNIAFAFSYSMILIEIQDTIKSPNEGKTMKKANVLGVLTTSSFYMMCGCIGYAAFGNDAPGNLLTGFGFYEPYWLLDIANMCVVVHLVGAYQVFCQPLFAFVEGWLIEKFPKNHLIVDKVVKVKKIGYEASLLQILWRTTFVVFSTLVSMLLPFFNDILGILGALAFWPLTVFFPIYMHIRQSNIRPWTKSWIFLQCLSIGCLLISLAALAGSIHGVLHDVSSYTPFKTQPSS